MKKFRTYHLILSVLLLQVVSLFHVFSQTKQSLDEQRRQLLLEIDVTDRLINETVRTKELSFAKLNLLNAQEDQYKRLIASINANISVTNRQINTTVKEIEKMKNDIEKMKTEYAKLIIQSYKNRGRYNKIIYVLSSNDFNEAYRRMKYFQQYSEYRKKQVAEIGIKLEELDEKIELLNVQRSEYELLMAEQRRESAKLQAIRTELNKEVNGLKTQESRYRAQLNEQKQRERQLQAEIEKIIRDEARRRGTTPERFYEALTPEERITSNNFRANRGKLPWPVERGVVTKKFGNIFDPMNRNIQLQNPGIQITTVANADVRAVFDGVVSLVAGVRGKNITVIIRHGNFFTSYTNLVDVTVKQEDKVTTKQVIGKVYTENNMLSSILEFQINEGQTRQNPEFWLSKL